MMSYGTTKLMTESIFWISQSFSAWTFVLGKPSNRMLPFTVFSSSTMQPIMDSSGISAPFLMNFSASTPSGVLASICFRRTSPVEMCVILKFWMILSLIVPLPKVNEHFQWKSLEIGLWTLIPEPGAPKRNRFGVLVNVSSLFSSLLTHNQCTEQLRHDSVLMWLDWCEISAIR